MQKLDNTTRRTVCLIVLGAILLAMALNIKSVLGILGTLWNASSTVIAGLALGFVLNIPFTFFQHKVFAFMDKPKKKTLHALKNLLAIIATILIVGLFISLIVFIIIPVLVDAVKDIIVDIGIYARGFPKWLTQLAEKLKLPQELIDSYTLDRSVFMNGLTKFLNKKSSNLLSTTATLTKSVISVVSSVTLSLVVAIYTLACKTKLQRFAIRLLDNFATEKFSSRIKLVAKTAYTSFSNFVAGQFIENLILGALCYIGMSVLDFPYAAPISVIVAIAQLVPVIGGIVSAALGVLLMLTISPLKALLFLIFIIVVQQLEGNFIYPKVVGDKIGLPGIAVISAVIIGGELFGILGVLIGIPACSTIYALLKIAMDNKEKRVGA